MGEIGGVNIHEFNHNNSLNFIDPFGLEAYTAYRQLAIPVVEYMWYLLHSSGHVYLAFQVDGEGLSEQERSEWCKFLNSKEIGFTKKAYPTQNAKEYHNWVTFSFHPKSVDPKTAKNEGDLVLTLITEDSFVDLNNFSRDINSVIDGSATRQAIGSSIEEQKQLFKMALRSWEIKGSDYAGHFKYNIRSGYGFLRTNCGGWAKYITEKAGLKWPLSNRFYNLGVDVGGPLEIPAEIIDSVLRIGYEVFKDAEFGPIDTNDPLDPIGDKQNVGVGITIPLGW